MVVGKKEADILKPPEKGTTPTGGGDIAGE